MRLWVTLVILSLAVHPTNGLPNPKERTGKGTDPPEVHSEPTWDQVLKSRREKEKENEKEKEKETGPNDVQLPKHPGEDEAAAKPQTKETVSEADTAQASAKPEFRPTDWTDIKKCSMGAKGMDMPAKLNHAFFHQNAQALMDTFHISKSQAKEIISACPDCELVQPSAFMGVVSPKVKLKENSSVLIRNPETGRIERPFKLITWGKGFACVFTAVGLAAKHVKSYRVQTAETDPKTGGREVGTQTGAGVKTANIPSFYVQKRLWDLSFLWGLGGVAFLGIPREKRALEMKELSLCLILSLVALSNVAVLPLNQENVWETLGNASGLDTICLTHSKPGETFFNMFGGVASEQMTDSRKHPSSDFKVHCKSSRPMGCLDKIPSCGSF
ncbi:hypothetical protein DUI87_01855 [Hirundo rustica rustica]|uniref:Integrase-type domain-containing protein n=1 Tax=Hirundo rustica rustica TaxID=333673 RepID=A0A3M0LD90_HIRRU|nr:hypothetical protein DUI87_01855 [Hirundo rustica rustica]